MARRKKNLFGQEEDILKNEDLSVGPLIQKEEAVPETRPGKVYNAPLVRVRDNPSDMGKVIRVLEIGDGVTIIGDVTNKFYKVQLDKDTVGYISSDFCMEVEKNDE